MSQLGRPSRWFTRDTGGSGRGNTVTSQGGEAYNLTDLIFKSRMVILGIIISKTLGRVGVESNHNRDKLRPCGAFEIL